MLAVLPTNPSQAVEDCLLALHELGRDEDGPVAASALAAYLIGGTAPEIGASLADAGVPLKHCGDLEHAVAAAHAAARPGDVVLLSPACASFDQFGDFEARGLAFRAAFAALSSDSPAPEPSA